MHGTSTGRNGDLNAAIGACRSDIARCGYIQVGPSFSGAKATYEITGGAASGGGFNHFTPVYGHTANADNNPQYQNGYT